MSATHRLFEGQETEPCTDGAPTRGARAVAATWPPAGPITPTDAVARGPRDIAALVRIPPALRYAAALELGLKHVGGGAAAAFVALNRSSPEEAAQVLLALLEVHDRSPADLWAARRVSASMLGVQADEAAVPCQGLAGLAVDLLHAVRAGDGRSVELAPAFALAVGQGLEPVNRLIAAVLAGGPFTIRRAMELAEIVLATSAAPAASVHPMADLAVQRTKRGGR